MSKYCLFYIQIETFCFSHKVRKSLKTDWWWHRNFLSCLFLYSELTWLLNLHDCPIPGTVVFERVLKSLGPQQGGNEWASFSQKSFATSCGESRGCPVHSHFLGCWAPLGQGEADCVPSHKIVLDMGLVRIAGCIFLNRCRKYPGGFPTALIMHMFGLITPCTFFTHSLPQVFPDNANVGTFCPKLISQECYQTASKRVFSGISSPWLCRKSENHAVVILKSTQDCISSPVSSH